MGNSLNRILEILHCVCEMQRGPLNPCESEELLERKVAAPV
jgi:hypothetical protein